MQIQKYKDTNAKISSGLVDGHTHPVWAGDRVHEFAMKLAGASYMEVLYSIYAIYRAIFWTGYFLLHSIVFTIRKEPCTTIITEPCTQLNSMNQSQ